MANYVALPQIEVTQAQRWERRARANLTALFLTDTSNLKNALGPRAMNLQDAGDLWMAQGGYLWLQTQKANLKLRDSLAELDTDAVLAHMSGVSKPPRWPPDAFEGVIALLPPGSINLPGIRELVGEGIRINGMWTHREAFGVEPAATSTSVDATFSTESTVSGMDSAGHGLDYEPDRKGKRRGKNKNERKRTQPEPVEAWVIDEIVEAYKAQNKMIELATTTASVLSRVNPFSMIKADTGLSKPFSK